MSYDVGARAPANELEGSTVRRPVTPEKPAAGDRSRTLVPGARGDVLFLTPNGKDGDHLAATLTAAGYHVRVARPDGASLDRALKNPPALVLATLSRAGDGLLAFVESLGRELGHLAPPVLAVADEDCEDTLERAFAIGIKDVLSKPVPASLLRVKVQRTATQQRPFPERFGAYAIQRVLGRGAMGTVYLARLDGHDVALKVLDLGNRGLDPEALARFRREAEVLRSLRGTAIPLFLDAGRIDDHFFTAMEFVPGDTLSRVIESNGPLSAQATARIVDEVAATLEVLHQAGLVHRDVKPTNVIVTPSGRSQLVDFGLAKAIGDMSLTRPNEILGTAPYMAPELCRNGTTDALTDAFALGITGLEALFGGCPVRGSCYEVAERHARGLVPRASDWVKDGDEDLLEVLDGLLAPSRDDRWELTDVRHALRARIARLTIKPSGRLARLSFKKV